MLLQLEHLVESMKLVEFVLWMELLELDTSLGVLELLEVAELQLCLGSFLLQCSMLLCLYFIVILFRTLTIT